MVLPSLACTADILGRRVMITSYEGGGTYQPHARPALGFLLSLLLVLLGQTDR